MSGDVLATSSSVTSNTQLLFSSEQLIELLNRVRGSAVPKPIKLSLRDLVLEYAQATSEDLKKDLEAELLDALDDFPEEFDLYIKQLKSGGVTAPTPHAAPTSTKPQAATSAVGRARLQPAFGARTVPAAPVTPEVPADLPTTNSVVNVTPTSITAEAETITAAPAPSEPVVNSVPVEPVAAPAVPVSEPVLGAAPTPAATTAGDPLARIKEIKKLVNEKVGNPVNLIDANNEVGREYMNALLDAMKKVTGGVPEEVGQAMERLEVAFASVQKTIEQKPAATAAVPAPEPTSAPTPAATEPAEVPADTTPSVSVPEPAVSTPAVSEPAAAPVTPKPDPVSETPLATESVTPPAPAGSLQSVASQIAATPAPAETTPDIPAQGPAAGSPLMSQNVTAGLNQLLSEWKLFKSSGLFGTGPSGQDHPLYQSIASLPMSSVVAGRFEGATPEIKQSITDYMNGWRYEQGMVHEMNETFEHYLRRVIDAILQKQPAPAE